MRRKIEARNGKHGRAIISTKGLGGGGVTSSEYDHLIA